MFGREAAGLHQCDRQGVTDGHRHSRTCGGRESFGICFALDAGVEHHVHLARQGRGRIAQDPDERRPEFAECRDQIEQFGGRTAFGDHQDGIAGLAHAQIAMSGLGGMQKDGGCASALERRRDLAGDVPGFADARDDQFPGMAQNQFHRCDQVAVQARGCGQNSLSLCFHDLTRGGEPLGTLVDWAY